MKRRYISDEGYALIMMAIGVAVLIGVFVLGIDDPGGMIVNAAWLFISIGGLLQSIVADRKRRGLDVPPEARPPAPPVSSPTSKGRECSL